MASDTKAHSRYSPDRLIATKHAADAVGVSQQTLRRWRTIGVGPAFVRVGGKAGFSVRYRESDIAKWLATNTVNPTMGATDVHA